MAQQETKASQDNVVAEEEMKLEEAKGSGDSTEGFAGHKTPNRKSGDNLDHQHAVPSQSIITSSTENIEQVQDCGIMGADGSKENENSETAGTISRGKETSKVAEPGSPKASEEVNIQAIEETACPETMSAGEILQNTDSMEIASVSQEIDPHKASDSHFEGNSLNPDKFEGVIEETSREISSNVKLNSTRDDALSESDSYSTCEDDSDVPITPQDTTNPSKPVHVTVGRPLQNTGLAAIASEYLSSESENDDSLDSIEVVSAEMPPQQHRTTNVILSSDTDPDSDIEIVSQTSAPPRVFDIDDDDEENNGKPKGPVRAKGELLLDDLPPIEDLHITVPEEQCSVLGKVHSIVEQLVLVDCIPGTAALDLDTVLFLDKGNKVLGEVFDVIGQISNPLYCVRFNSNKQIKEKGIEVGDTVYVAPKTEHTRFIILPTLMSIRGSDASWEDDVEPPEKHLDYSDDEEERSARRAVKSKKQQTDETDTPKRPKSTPRPPPQQSRIPRQRFQGAQQYNSPGPGSNSGHSSPAPPFQYDATNTTWHANFNSPPPLFYPNPFARTSFNSPGNNRQMYPSPNFPQPQFNSPNSGMPQFVSPNQRHPQYPMNQNSPQFVPPNMHFGADYSRPPFMAPNQPQNHFTPPNHPNQSFAQPHPQSAQFGHPPNRSQFASPNYMYRPPLFPTPPPPPPPPQ